MIRLVNIINRKPPIIIEPIINWRAWKGIIRDDVFLSINNKISMNNMNNISVIGMKRKSKKENWIRSNHYVNNSTGDCKEAKIKALN